MIPLCWLSFSLSGSASRQGLFPCSTSARKRLTATMYYLALLFLALLIANVHAGTNAEGLKYLAAKEKEEGVVKLPSGLLYKGTYAFTSAKDIVLSSHFYTFSNTQQNSPRERARLLLFLLPPNVITLVVSLTVRNSIPVTNEESHSRLLPIKSSRVGPKPCN